MLDMLDLSFYSVGVGRDLGALTCNQCACVQVIGVAVAKLQGDGAWCCGSPGQRDCGAGLEDGACGRAGEGIGVGLCRDDGRKAADQESEETHCVEVSLEDQDCIKGYEKKGRLNDGCGRMPLY